MVLCLGKNSSVILRIVGALGAESTFVPIKDQNVDLIPIVEIKGVEALQPRLTPGYISQDLIFYPGHILSYDQYSFILEMFHRNL